MKRNLIGFAVGIIAILVITALAAISSLTTIPSTPAAASGPCGATSVLSAAAPVASTAGALPAAKVATYAAAAGWSGGDLAIAVAITMPESGADPSTVQKGQPLATTGWGLWQITPGDASLLDPLANARAAYKKFVDSGNTFSPWTTFNNGAYKQYMNWAQAGVQTFLANGVPLDAKPCVVPKTATVVAASGDVKIPVIHGPIGMEQRMDHSPVFGQLWPGNGDPGQCTIWASTNHPGGISWNGNAADWWVNSRGKATETQTPAIGEIVVYRSDSHWSQYGHVGVVIDVGSGWFTVSEMNVIGVDVVDERVQAWPSPSEILGFIV